jgi:hypothetical protein
VREKSPTSSERTSPQAAESVHGVLLQRFKGLLGTSLAGESGVIRRIFQRFPGRTSEVVAAGDQQLARDLFEDARRLPSTVTEADLAASGYLVGEPLFPGSNLSYCFNGLWVGVVKPLKEDEARRATALAAALPAGGGGLGEHVVSFTLWRRPEAPGAAHLIMPKQAATLSDVPWLPPAGARTLLVHLLAGLDDLHSLGFAHCDVKPDNVCISQAQSCSLVDLGSVARFGERAQSTRAYLPADLYPRDGQPLCSSCELDAWMLAATLAEKCCPRERCVNFGETRMKGRQLLSHLEAHLASELWLLLTSHARLGPVLRAHL